MLERTTDLTLGQLQRELQKSGLSPEQHSFYIREIGVLAICGDTLAEEYLCTQLPRADIPEMAQETLYLHLVKITCPTEETLQALNAFEEDPKNAPVIDFVTNHILA